MEVKKPKRLYNFKINAFMMSHAMWIIRELRKGSSVVKNLWLYLAEASCPPPLASARGKRKGLHFISFFFFFLDKGKWS